LAEVQRERAECAAIASKKHAEYSNLSFHEDDAEDACLAIERAIRARPLP
jgi:hypothetical protein